MWHRLRKLSFFRPVPNIVKVFALMFCVEIHKRFRMIDIPPHLAEQSCIRCTHQLLADDIQAMTDMVSNDVILIQECPLTLRTVVVDVIIEGLAQKVQAVEMMQPLHVRREASAIFGIWTWSGFNPDLVACSTGTAKLLSAQL
jgi:hypothetical protein